MERAFITPQFQISNKSSSNWELIFRFSWFCLHHFGVPGFEKGVMGLKAVWSFGCCGEKFVSWSSSREREFGRGAETNSCGHLLKQTKVFYEGLEKEGEKEVICSPGGAGRPVIQLENGVPLNPSPIRRGHYSAKAGEGWKICDIGMGDWVTVAL